MLGATAQAQEPPGQSLSQRAGVPYQAVIAHRGASFHAPEETAAAFKLARDLGADYLELDLQRSKDGVLIALHDDTLKRTSNVQAVFPDRADRPASDFTLAELKQLDAGTWFNTAFPERARPGFVGLTILTLDEVLDIAEGGDNKPGLYIETKVPGQFPGIELQLQQALNKRGWLGDDRAAPVGFDAGQQVAVGYGEGRVILQTFEKSSLSLLHKYMPEVPKIFLLWLGDGYIAKKTEQSYAESGAKDYASYYAQQQVQSEAELAAWLDFAVANGAVGTGPSAQLDQGGAESYPDLLKPWMNQMTHDRKLLIHAYTVDDPADLARLSALGVDGFFSNRPDLLLAFYGRKPRGSVEALLDQAGF
ncbi:MAG: glycerophosphodiester phosphodiesterase [Pseudomonas sp.]|uniref:glycerophosphodiester phosphodiesterase n=1 Tax=Pseudomonas sp. TaxID=306 RepID=UPI0033953F08